jgi:hypothetical protein
MIGGYMDTQGKKANRRTDGGCVFSAVQPKLYKEDNLRVRRPIPAFRRHVICHIYVYMMSSQSLLPPLFWLSGIGGGGTQQGDLINPYPPPQKQRKAG